MQRSTSTGDFDSPSGPHPFVNALDSNPNNDLALFLNHQNFDANSWGMNPFPDDSFGEDEGPLSAAAAADSDEIGYFKTVDHPSSHGFQKEFSSRTTIAGSKTTSENNTAQLSNSFLPQSQHSTAPSDARKIPSTMGPTPADFRPSFTAEQNNSFGGPFQNQRSQSFPNYHQQQQNAGFYDQFSANIDQKAHFQSFGTRNPAPVFDDDISEGAMEDSGEASLMHQIDSFNNTVQQHLDNSNQMEIDDGDDPEFKQKKRKRKPSFLSYRGLNAKTVKYNNHERRKSQSWIDQEMQFAQQRVQMMENGVPQQYFSAPQQFNHPANFSYQQENSGFMIPSPAPSSTGEHSEQMFDSNMASSSTSSPITIGASKNNGNRPKNDKSVVSHDQSIANVKRSSQPARHPISKQKKATKNTTPARGAIANFISHFLSPKKKEISSVPSDENGSVSLSSKMAKYSVFTMDGLLWIRKFKCLALEMKIPFEIPETAPVIEYKLYVKQKDATEYYGVITHEFVEYEFSDYSAKDERTTIPLSHINREKRTLRVPFKLTKGQKELVGGYKNTFKLKFTIKWNDSLGVTAWFSYRCDSRGKDEKNTYSRVSHIVGYDQVWFSGKGRDKKVETTELVKDTPIIFMEPRIVPDEVGGMIPPKTGA